MLLAKYTSIFTFIMLLIGSQAMASDDFQFSGFATIGAVHSDSENYGYRKHVGSDSGVYSGEIDFKQHSLLGLQADWAISSNFDAVYQGVLRDLPEPSFDRYTTLAFLRYQINTNWTVRAGRTAPDIFLLTEYRDVDFSYIWATAPNEVYGIIPYRSIDGLDVTYNQRKFGGTFTAKFFTGSSESEISADTLVQEVNIEDIFGLSLSFDHFDWIVNVKHSQVTLANEPESNAELAGFISQVPDFLWPNSQDFAQSLLMEGEDLTYSSVSGQYQWRNWLATAEFAQINSDSDVLRQVTSGYAALSYQLSEHQLYGIFAFTNTDTYVFDEPGVNEIVLEELIHVTTDFMNFYAANQQTISLGWRWDINSYLASSLQWNYSRIDEAGGSPLWLNPTDYKAAENVNTFLLTLSMVY